MVLSMVEGRPLIALRAPEPALLSPIHDREAFVAAPIGRCIVRPTFVIWCATADLQGSILWGALDERSIGEMMAIGAFIHHPDIAASRRVLTDLREIDRAGADVLLGFAQTARERVATWATGLERQAMIVPDGVAGMMMSGTLPMAGTDHSLGIAHDLGAALAFLAHPLAAAAHAAAAAIAGATRGPSALLTRLRMHLNAELVHATIASSATALGLSIRTLQRALRGLDTSFSDELRRARIASAEALLVHSDLKIDAIALQVGYRTASRLSASLRSALNLTASELRAGHRASPG